MKIPRRLKEIISSHAPALTIEQEKRNFALTSEDGRRMLVDLGHVVTLKQWDDLADQIKRFKRGQPVKSAKPI